MARMKFPISLWPFGDHRAFGYERGRRIWDLQIRPVENIVELIGQSFGVGRRSQRGRFDIAGHQRCQRLRIAAALHKAKIPIRFQTVTAQRLDREIMSVAADAADRDPFPFEILGSFESSARDQTLGHDIFYPADENHIGGTADVGDDVADTAGQSHLSITAEQAPL